MDGSSVTDAALRQDYIERARELMPMLRDDADECEKYRQVTERCVNAMIDPNVYSSGTMNQTMYK